ncbi:MAG: hypothetical protein AAF447_02720 [Myxococcota bacterium]
MNALHLRTPALRHSSPGREGRRRAKWPGPGARVLLATWALVAPLSVAEAAPLPLRYRVDATLHAGRDARVEAHLDVRVRVDAGAESLRLWVGSDRLAVVPAALDEQSGRWIFPREADLTVPRVADVQVDGEAAETRWERHPVGSARGRDTAGADLHVALRPGPARVVTLTLRFRQQIPERFGRLGRVGDRISLTAPWYPLVVAEDSYRLGAVHDVRMALVGRGELRVPGASARAGAPLRVRRRVPFVPVFAARRFHRRVERVDGVPLLVLSPRRLPHRPAPDAEGVARLRDLSAKDRSARVRRLGEEAATTLRSLAGEVAGSLPAEPAPTEVWFVPSRTELAGNAPQAVLLSDRLYEVTPLPPVLAFHDRAVLRALFTRWVEAAVARSEPPGDRDWALDLRAVLLADLDLRRRASRVRTARELLGWAGFNPVIDQLLYAPQVAFVDTYFGAVSEPDPYREAPDRARRPRARGRRVLESARDALPEAAFEAWTRAVLALEPARAALEAASPERASRLDGWLAGPGRAVNYRLVSAESTAVAGGYVHRIVVARDVVVLDPETADLPGAEALDVEVRDADGNVLRGVWDGEGERGEARLRSAAPLRLVRLDPSARRAQDATATDGHPRADDGNRWPLRPPILEQIDVSYNATARQVVFVADAALRRQYDLRNTVTLRATGNVRGTGGSLGYVRGLGRRRDTNRRRIGVGGSLSATSLNAGFAGGDNADVGGARLGAGVSAGYGNQRYFLDPRQGWRLGGSLGTAVVLRDDDTRSWTLSANVRGNVTVPTGLRGALVVAYGGTWIFGDPTANERAGVGGRFLLRGYEANEALGRGRAFLVVEQRFTPTLFSDLHLGIFELAYVREIQLAAFAGLAGLADAFGVDPDDDGNLVFVREGRVLAAEIGFGVRVHFEYLGIQPAVLVVDVAAPLLREDDDRQRRGPVSVLLAFEQFF